MLAWLRLWTMWVARALLLATALGSALPGELHIVCDPAQCLSEGRAADSESAPDDADCSGLFHVCHCCAHLQVVPQRAGSAIAPPRFAGFSQRPAAASSGPSGYSAPLLRPPSA